MLRFQQLTSPVMAKGLEDTAFYRYFPLVALNEVGGGTTARSRSTRSTRAASAAPPRRRYGMSATATHDTKRGEDVRARLCVLSELPADWHQALIRLYQLARPHKRSHDVPDANEEYLLYQTLLGAWPVHGRDRTRRSSRGSSST